MESTRLGRRIMIVNREDALCTFTNREGKDGERND